MSLFGEIFDVGLFELYLKEKVHTISSMSRIAYVYAITTYTAECGHTTDLEVMNEFLIKHTIKKRSGMYYNALKHYIRFKETDKNKKYYNLEHLVKPKNFLNKKPVKERENLDEQEIINIINNLERPKHKILSLVQHTVGVRAGDVMRIQRGNIIPDIYEGKNVLKLVIYAKGDKKNVVYIHEETTQEIIMDYLVKNVLHPDYYFLEDTRISRTEGDDFLYLVNYNRYLNDLKNALEKSGINKDVFATHDYRRCFAVRVWKKYKDFYILKNILNHSRAETTMRYLAHGGLNNIDYFKELQSE